jgi:hypothetical protein
MRACSFATPVSRWAYRQTLMTPACPQPFSTARVVQGTAEIAQVFPDDTTSGTVLLLRDGSRFVASQAYWWFVQRLTGGETAMEGPKPLDANP